MEKKKVIVGIGELLWDMLPSGKAIGGAPANFAYHAGRLGEEGWVISAVGDDILGREIMDALKFVLLTKGAQGSEVSPGTKSYPREQEKSMSSALSVPVTPSRQLSR